MVWHADVADVTVDVVEGHPDRNTVFGLCACMLTLNKRRPQKWQRVTRRGRPIVYCRSRFLATADVNE
jgi:hypothetical protein